MKRTEQAPGRPKDPVATAFLTLSLIFGTLFLFLTPPFQVPDEPAHFFRAYAISEGSFRIHTWDGVAAQPLPASLPAFAAELVGRKDPESAAAHYDLGDLGVRPSPVRE